MLSRAFSGVSRLGAAAVADDWSLQIGVGFAYAQHRVGCQICHFAATLNWNGSQGLLGEL